MKINEFRGIFIKGLIAVLPIAATFYLMLWLITSFEAFFGSILQYALPESAYVPGMGVAAGLVGIFLVGLLMDAWLGRRLWALGERVVDRMPLVSQIYGAVKEIVSYIGGSEQQPRGKAVVTIKFGDPPVRMLGLVTLEELAFLPQTPGDELIAVFLPWSYQIGGFTVYVPRSAVEKADLSAQEALRISLTAGVTTQAKS
jgi:uncharacterized membrane protein